MAGHIDEADDLAVRQGRVGEAQIDGHAAPLLVRQPVGIHARQCLDQRGLAVVDMPGQSDNQAAPAWAGLTFVVT